LHTTPYIFQTDDEYTNSLFHSPTPYEHTSNTNLGLALGPIAWDVSYSGNQEV